MKSNFDNNQDMRNKLRDNGITDAQSLIDKYKEAKNIDSSLNINSYLDNVIKKCL